MRCLTEHTRSSTMSCMCARFLPGLPISVSVWWCVRDPKPSRARRAQPGALAMDCKHSIYWPPLIDRPSSASCCTQCFTDSVPSRSRSRSRAHLIVLACTGTLLKACSHGRAPAASASGSAELAAGAARVASCAQHARQSSLLLLPWLLCQCHVSRRSRPSARMVPIARTSKWAMHQCRHCRHDLP